MNLQNIPSKKFDLMLADELCAAKCKACERCNVIQTAFVRYFQANIPIEYWKSTAKSFTGPLQLKAWIDESADIAAVYKRGETVCLAGNHGIGKTTAGAILLKAAANKGFSAFYTTAPALAASVGSGAMSVQDLAAYDFLMVDEVDPRFFPTGAAANFFGRSIEVVIRDRQSNRMPLVLATNSPNLASAFLDEMGASIGSLFKRVKVVAAIGTDQRGTK